MHVRRVGFTPLKGARHAEHPAVQLDAGGPVGDRVFCLVDPARDRVLRTVENPALLEADAALTGEELTVALPAGTVAGVPVPTGEVLAADYWGREAKLELLDGPWSEAFSAHLGYDVRLARASRAGEVVYGGSVTLVTTSSVDRLGRWLGLAVAAERFRATFLVDTGDLEPHAEDGWIGHEVALGKAVVRVRGSVPRCAVVDLNPKTGVRDVPVLKALAGYRLSGKDVHFGVDAEVVVPGRVATGDPATLRRDE
ncbi:MAG: MOSC domain-containing protein [Nocardioides sp.]